MASSVLLVVAAGAFVELVIQATCLPVRPTVLRSCLRLTAADQPNGVVTTALAGTGGRYGWNDPPETRFARGDSAVRGGDGQTRTRQHGRLANWPGDVRARLAVVQARQADCQDRQLPGRPYGLLHLRPDEDRHGRRRGDGV